MFSDPLYVIRVYYLLSRPFLLLRLQLAGRRLEDYSLPPTLSDQVNLSSQVVYPS